MKVQLRSGRFFNTDDILYVTGVRENRGSFYFDVYFRFSKQSFTITEEFCSYSDLDVWDKKPIELKRQLMNKAEELIKKTHEELHAAWKFGDPNGCRQID